METPPPYVNLQSAQPESRFLPAFPPPAQRWLVKIIIIGVALLLFQLPLYMIGEVSLERSKNFSQVEAQIADSWGKAQELSIVSSADNVAVNAELSPEIRYRGIYHVLVYTAAMQLDFSYSKAPAGGKGIRFSGRLATSSPSRRNSILRVLSLLNLQVQPCKLSPPFLPLLHGVNHT